MGSWDYQNIGASAKPNNKRHIGKIFEYIGYASSPDYDPEGDECTFTDPEVYCCKYSRNDRADGNIKQCFEDMDEEELLYLLNAIFPKTNVYSHAAAGNDTSDTWENHDIVYDTKKMTRYCDDSYTSYDCGPNGKRTSKARFALKAPKAEYVSALIALSTEDGNTELTALLQDLAQRLKDGLVVYTDDPSDKREIGIEYDIEDNVEGDEYDDYYDEDKDEEDEEYDEEDDNTLIDE